jgi:hypothetical protein
VAQVVLETVQRLPVSLPDRLDATVLPVANPALYPFAGRRVASEEAEPDALNAAADQVTSRETHAEKRKIIV